MQELEIKKALKDWPKMVIKYSQPDTKKAIIQLLNTFLPFVAIWILMYYSLETMDDKIVKKMILLDK